MTVRALIALAWLCLGASGVWAQIAVEGGVRDSSPTRRAACCLA